jgi:hypothetical protein
MLNDEPIVNRVSNSSLVTFDLEAFYVAGERVLLDIKDQLFQGLILREKDFREFIRSQDWSGYKGKYVAIVCSADAVVPTWAYMLLSIALQPFANEIVFGSLQQLEIELFKKQLQQVDWNEYKGAKVVVKGCSKVDVPVALYVDVAAKLRPVAASIMFGEPCSTVPIFKRPSSKI